MSTENVVIIKADGKKAVKTFQMSSYAPPVIENIACDITVYEGAAVRIDSGTVYNALADSLANSNVLGIVEEKLNDTTCNVRVMGVTLDHYTGLDETKEYFLSDTVAGALTTTVPVTTGHVRLKLGQPFDSERFVFMKGERVVRT